MPACLESLLNVGGRDTSWLQARSESEHPVTSDIFSFDRIVLRIQGGRQFANFIVCVFCLLKDLCAAVVKIFLMLLFSSALFSAIQVLLIWAVNL